MSKQPWELRDSDERKADTKLIFIIFCEDKNSEPIYFKYFETPKIKVNLVKEQDSGMRHVLKAIKRCKDDRLMEYNENGELELTDEEVHIWCVFDMDLDINNESRDNISFDEGIQLAEGKGIKVAWSNDAFELWVLLHFNEINPELPENKLRDTYYDNLTKIFRNLPKKNEDLKKALQHASFGYKKDLKGKDNFRYIVRPEIIPNTSLAIQRAKTLEAHYSNDQPNHEKAPCTMVHHLVEALLLAGGKSIGEET